MNAFIVFKLAFLRTKPYLSIKLTPFICIFIFTFPANYGNNIDHFFCEDSKSCLNLNIVA